MWRSIGTWRGRSAGSCSRTRRCAISPRSCNAGTTSRSLSARSRSGGGGSLPRSGTSPSTQCSIISRSRSAYASCAMGKPSHSNPGDVGKRSGEAMMRRHVALLSSLFALVAGPSSTSAQEASPSLSPDGPRFLLATSSSMVPVDAQRAPVLRQRVSLDVVDGSIEAAFAELTRQTGVHFVYSTDVVPADKRVRVRVHHVTLAAALSALLTGDMDVVVSEGGGTLIVRPGERRRAARPKRTAPGIIQGYVREQGSGTPIVHVDVSVEGGGRALTNESGFYRITDVPPGRHRVTAKSIGYAPSTQEVEVGDSATVRLNFELENAPTRLAEIVTTVAGERRRLEIGNDITVLNVDSIVKNEPVNSVTDILEGRVPGLVVQRTSGVPGDPARIRIRGASSPRLSNDPIIIVYGVRVYP